MKFFDSNGIVINKKDFGEADRYITIFTETFGKVNVLVKGIRKSKNKVQLIYLLYQNLLFIKKEKILYFLI